MYLPLPLPFLLSPSFLRLLELVLEALEPPSPADDETLAAAALACLTVRSHPRDCPESSLACSYLSRLSFSAS
eukprot:3089773-Pyramimonas_sp.AAC.1